MESRGRYSISILLVAMLALYVAQSFMQKRDVAELPYSELQTLLASKKVKDLVVSSDEIRGELTDAKDGKRFFVSRRVAPELAQQLDQHKVRYRQAPESEWLPMFVWMLPMLVLFGLSAFAMRRMAGGPGGGAGLMTIGKSKAKVYMEKETGVTFADVAGVDEAKAELQEVVSFLRDPKSYGRLGARMPKGVLLVGPPGTGKTLLARAVAGEAGVTFFSISGSEFVEMFVGVGAARVRDLFEQARAKAPCIIFIDELDALGRARQAGGMMGGHDEKEQTLNQLLVELDGFDSSSGIVLLSATNRPEILDPALLRAGRFDRQVLVDRPDRKGRVDILKVHVKKVRLDTDASLDVIASMTPGFTGADLANLVNEAALVATRRGAETVSKQDFTSAIERIIAGLEKRNRLLNPVERRVVAYHEMGHALVATAIPGSDQVHKISIIPRGIGALGYTIQRPTDDRYLMTRQELENKMTVLLGGRASEFLVFEHFSTGAADDLAKATDIARSMATQYGMIPELGHVTYERPERGYLGLAQPRRDYSESTAHEIDAAVRECVERAFKTAHALLKEHRDLLERGAQKLLDVETLDEDQLRELFGELRRPSTEPQPAAPSKAAE